MVATYDIPVGTELLSTWTLDGAVLCNKFGAINEAVIRGESFRGCEPTIALGSGTYALTIQHNGQTVGAYSQYIMRDALITVSNLSFIASTAAFCDLSRPLGPSHNLRASDLGLCLVATYEAPLGTRLEFSWTLNGRELCDNAFVVEVGTLLGETLACCDPISIPLASGTYAVAIAYNGGTVESYSQYITRDSSAAAGVLEGTEPIAFVSGTVGPVARASRLGDNHDIYTMRPGGTDVRLLTVNDASASNPAWSPDGTRIAFRSDRDGDFGEIYTMRSDGTDVRQLTVNSWTDIRPDWSP